MALGSSFVNNTLPYYAVVKGENYEHLLNNGYFNAWAGFFHTFPGSAYVYGAAYTHEAIAAGGDPRTASAFFLPLRVGRRLLGLPVISR